MTAAATRQSDRTSPGGAITPGDLGELMASFNEVTERLEATHRTLRGEVARLNRELHEANERLRRSQRLAELGEMAAGIAHEIRNPLGSISLYTEMLSADVERARAEGVLDEASVSIAGRIASEVRRMDAIVRDVLSFARELRVRPEPVEIGELFDEAVHSSRTTRGGDPVFERADRAGGRPRTVRCDRSLGLQALLNVIENARQAAPGGEPITLDARRVTLRGGDGSACPGVALVVTDRGPGIDAGVLDRMFNPFFTTRPAGTGLGLAIVHRIIDAHGGCVVVRNNSELDPGARGATVELRFPDSPDTEKETE
ncbi:MAG TPA: hypothetical protein ENK11_09455 [Phycisphaerales bacterium]|nr:hypothetical protein [Phycisphaerales bacterium]